MNEDESQSCDMPPTTDLEEESAKPLLFSRHNIGKNRWFWVVGQFMEDPLGSGISNSPEEAFSEAQNTFGNLLMNGNWQARSEWQKRRATERSKAKSDSAEPAPMEFVYECHRSDSDFASHDDQCISPHLIVKRTRKRIYVDRESFRDSPRTSGEWWDWHRPTFVLNRKEFEATGKANGNTGRWYNTYYASPEIYLDRIRSISRPECFERLGVESGATQKDVKIAYFRLAKSAHPDAGGDVEQFKQLQKAFEDALIIAKRNDAKEEID